MKPFLIPMTLALALACASMTAHALGRVADVQVIDRSSGRALPTYFHRGEYWVAGQPGAKYSIQIRNARGSRVLAVTSVDGLNVLTGETADFGQSGYVFERGQRYGIEGWRKSDHEVAAFVFTASGDSYAERIGKPRDVGVIGVALFREQAPADLYSPPAISQRQEVPSPAPGTAELTDKLRESASGTAQAPTSKAAPAMREPAPSAAAALPPPAPVTEAKQADASARKAAPAMERERSASALPYPMPVPLPNPKLGTAHGERESSIVTRTQFIRASERPDKIIRIRYDSHANLMAMGIIPIPRPLPQPVPNPFPANAGYVPDPPAHH
jgi:hypothetical protein